MSTYNKSGKLKLNPDKIISKKRKLNPDKLRVESAYVYKLQNDVSEKRLRSLNESLDKMRSGWQDKETMERTRQELSSVRESIDRYNNFLSFSGSKNGNSRLNTLSNAYGQMLEDFDSYADAYSAFEESIKKEGTRFVGEARKEYIAKAYADSIKAAEKKQKEYYDKWGHFADEADFDEYVKKGKKTGDNPNSILQNVPFILQNDNQLQNIAKNTGIAEDDFLIDDERNIYNYLLGKYGANKADEYLEDIQDVRNYRAGKDAAEKIQGIDNTFLRALTQAGYSVYAGLDQFTTGTAQTFSDKPLSSNMAYTNEELVQNLDGFAKYAYQAGNSIGNMLPSIAIAAMTGGAAGQLLGAGTMGASAGGNAYGQALAEGYSEEQARAYGVLVGASEGGLQYLLGGIGKLGGKVGLGKVGKIAEKAANIDNALLRVSAKLGLRILDETIEEELQNCLEPAFRTILFDEDYDAPDVEELIETAIVTALSTGALEGGSTVSRDIRETALQNARLDMRYSGQEEAFNTALANVVGQERAAEMLKGEYLPSRKETNAALQMAQSDSNQTNAALREYAGELAAYEAQVRPDSKDTQELQRRINSGDNISGRDIDRIVRQQETRWRKQNEGRSFLHDKEVVGQAAQKRLAELGESYDIPAISAAITKQVAGEKLTAKEIHTIENSEYGMRVASEMDPAHVGTGQYTNAYLDDLEPTQFYSRQAEAFLPANADSEQTAPVNAENLSENASSSGVNPIDQSSDHPEKNGVNMPTLPRNLDVSATGYTTITETGEAAPIQEIASIQDGVMKLRLQDGTEVDARDVSYASADEAMLYETVVNMGTNAATANALIKNYNPADGVSADIYAAGIGEAYKYGFYGISMEEMSQNTFSAGLTSQQGEFAYNMGVSDGRYHVDQKQKQISHDQNQTKTASQGKSQKRGSVYFEKGVQATTQRQKVSVTALEKIADILGIDIYIFASKTDKHGRHVGDNGWYDPKDGSIHIDVHAGIQGKDTILFTASHELTHFIRQGSPAKFKTLADFLFAEYGKKEVSVDALIQEQIKKAQNSGRNISYDTAYEEVVADSCETMLSDGKAVEKLAKLKAKDKGLYNKIKSFIQELAAKIRSVYEGLSPDSMEGRYVAEMKDAVDRLQELFAEGLSDASENHGNIKPQKENAVIEGTTKFQKRNAPNYDYSKPFAQQIKDYMAGKIPKGDTLIIGETPQVFQKLGFNALPMIINTTHVDYALYGTKDVNHSLGQSLLNQLPAALENPAAVITSKTQTNTSLVVLLPVKHRGNTVIAPVYIDGTGFQNGIRIDSNAVTSVFGKNNAVTKLLNDAIRDEKRGNTAVYYYNKKIADPLLQSAGLQLPGGLIPHGGYIHSIREKSSPVKPKLKNVTYSQQFKRWFGDWQKHPGTASKVVNEDGSPMVMYHGTPAANGEFTVFDSSEAVQKGGVGFNALGEGNYFTSTKDRAKQYAKNGGRIIACYLAIKNPYEVNRDIIAQMQADYGNKPNGKQQFTSFLKESGYDGIIMRDKAGNVWLAVAFESSQIKSATDNIGTFDSENNDIRYSMRDYSYDALTAKPDMHVTTLSGYVPKNRADVVFYAKKNAAKLGKFNPKDGSVTVHVNDIDTDVVLATNGLKHSLDRRLETNAPVIMKAGDILQNSIQINEMNPQKAEADSSYVLIGTAQNAKGELYVVRSVVNKFKNELMSMDVLYAMNAKKMESAAQMPRLTGEPAIRTDSTISISELLEYVNTYFPDILPEDVLRHFGHTGRPDGKLGQSALYSMRDYSYDALTAKPDMQVAVINDKLSYHETKTVRKNIVKQAIENAKKVGHTNENGNAVIHVNDIDSDVIISGAGLRHGLDRRLDVNVPVTLDVGKILQNAVRVNDLNPRAESIDETYVLIGMAKSTAGIPYPVSFVVNKHTSELLSFSVLYSMNAKKEPARLIDAGVPANADYLTGSTISIANLLEYVNTYFPDILPEDVLRHFGHTGRPDGKLGQSALYSMRDPQRVAELKEENKALKEENQHLLEDSKWLQELVRLQKRAVKGRVWKNSTVNIAAGILMERTQATGKTQELSALLSDFYEQISAGTQQGWKDVSQAAQPTVDWLMEHMKTDDFAASPQLTRLNVTAEVYDSYWRAATTRLSAESIQKDVNLLKQEHNQRMEAQRDRYRQRMDKLKKEMQEKARESRRKGIEGRSKTAMRAKIKREVSELRRMLLHGTKEKNIKKELQYIMVSLLDLVNMDTVSADRRVAEYNEKIGKETDPEKRAALIKSRDYIQSMGDNVGKGLDVFKAEYAKLKEAEDPELAAMYDGAVETLAGNVRELVGDTPLADMSLEQLRAVHDMFRAARTVVYNTNRLFKAGKEATVSQMQETIAGEIKGNVGVKGSEPNLSGGVKQFIWDDYIPVYAFRRIGSDTFFSKIYEKLQDGQDGADRDLAADKDFLSKTRKKYGWAKWDKDTKQSFASADGAPFSLNLLERMDLYNAAQRPQGRKHLLEGGIVLADKNIAGRNFIKRKKTVDTVYTLDDKIIDGICDTLTKEQKAFAYELQQYLAKVIGPRLNEISMELYGIEMYNEETYWPILTDQQFLDMLDGKDSDNLQARSYSFTNMLNSNANGPLIIGNVMDTWAIHVCDAATYHNLVLPLENFRKLVGKKNSPVRQALQAGFGTGPVAYLDKLYKDMNGGIRRERDSMQGLDKMISMSKKGAVLASASVAIQQPSAIARAFSQINPVYFVTSTPGALNWAQHNKKWNELKQYAPVAQIKEMGHFDMGMGRSTADWLLADNPRGIKEKAFALLTNGSGYRDEILSKMPGLADELTWVHIWEAVKKETAVKRKDLPVGSEEFLQAAGKRFTDVINLTQVYDSTLSRSGHMRNQNPLAKMATAFMAEPTVTANMIMDAAVQAKRVGVAGGIKIFSRTAVPIVASVLFNAVLKSIVTAARDDDEEKTYFEKYIGEVVANFLSDINPITFIPLAKDLVSLFDGYDVERLDMALISDLVRAVQGLESESKSEYEKISDVVGATANLFGVPIKNIYRDVRSMLNVIHSFGGDNETTKAGIEMAIDEATGKNSYTKAERIYTYYSAGETEEVTRMVEDMMQKGIGSGKTEDEARSAVRSSMTTMLKPIYLAAYIAKDEAEMKKIRFLMQETGAYGSVGDIIGSCKKWVKDLEDEGKAGEAIKKVEKTELYKPDVDLTESYQKLLKSLKG